MPNPCALDRPIFIVGPGRSGTTLLRSLLSAHSRIAVTPETKFMARAEEWGLKRGVPDDFDEFWSHYTTWLRFRDLGIEAARCHELIEIQNDYSFAAVFRAVLFAYGEKVGKLRIGEKTPTHVRYLPYLLEWFPDARILFTQRDPRAVVASQMKTYWVKQKLTPRSIRDGIFIEKRGEQILYWAKEWVADFDVSLKPWQGDPRFYTVNYEKLVSNTEEEMRAIFAFLDESFELSVLTERNAATVPLPVTEGIDPQMAQWRRDHHAKSMESISTDSLEKWKGELSRAEIAMIEGCCAKTMSTLGYAPSLSPRLQAAGRVGASVLSTGHSAESQLRKVYSGGRRRLGSIRARLWSTREEFIASGVKRGLPPAWFGYRHIIRETVQEYFQRHAGDPSAGRYETVHPEAVAAHPLPCNVPSRDDLPADQGWWGYSFHDVPQRTSTETFIATLPSCLITWYRDPEKSDDFYPAILNRDVRALDMREVRFRPRHAARLSTSEPPVKLKKATWFIERVYHNHSHWLTAHLPKLLLLRERDMLGDVLLPPERSTAIDGSLRMLGLEPEQFQTFDLARPLFVEELTIMGTDRFRPELLQLIPEAFGVTGADTPHRKVLISRLKASRRRLVNEDEVWSLLEPLGFERVFMEEMTFAAQVQLMRETAVLVAPHGAGLTNMLFCPRGAQIVEIADLGFPNPNFYAVASAMGHDYWLIPAESLGDLRPLDKDLRVDPAAIREILPALVPSSAGNM